MKIKCPYAQNIFQNKILTIGRFYIYLVNETFYKPPTIFMKLGNAAHLVFFDWLSKNGLVCKTAADPSTIKLVNMIPYSISEKNQIISDK